MKSTHYSFLLFEKIIFQQNFFFGLLFETAKGIHKSNLILYTKNVYLPRFMRSKRERYFHRRKEHGTSSGSRVELPVVMRTNTCPQTCLGC